MNDQSIDETFLWNLKGGMIHPLSPNEEEVDMQDIAVAMSNTCRYNGLVSSFYSVAQHSVIMSYWAEDLHEETNPDIARAALLHDAAEAWIGDIPSPLKRLCPMISKIEEKIAHMLFEIHGLDPALFDCEEIKELDWIMYQTEMRDVKPNQDPTDPKCCIPPEFVTIYPQMPNTAFENFKMRYNSLFADRALPVMDYHTPV